MKANPYDTLEVSPRARPSVIHAAYRVLAKEYGQDQPRLQAINIAKETVLNTVKRSDYDAKPAGKFIGNYRIIREIAAGGFGKTYLGEHRTLGTPVCLKHASKVSPQDEEIMLEEAKSIWDLRHFGIPAIRDIVKMPDGSMVLVMSYIPVPTLYQLVEKHGRLDPEHVCWISERILNILRYLHLHGIVHGDLKPQNVIVQPESHTVVLVDYGLSMVRPTATSANKGFTPLFAPPEQIRGGVLLPESDFFGLGTTMIFALAGDTDSVEGRRVPSKTPVPVRDFIKKLVVHDVLGRPNWEKEDLCSTLQGVREQAFGRKFSGMKPLPY